MNRKRLDTDKVMAFFSGSMAKAQGLIKDRERAGKVVEEAFRKARETKGPFAEIFDDTILMFSLAADYVKGYYRRVPVGSVVTILAGAVYFLTPIDVIPDFIPVAGYIDDVFVLSSVIRQVRADLDKYRAWKLVQKAEVESIGEKNPSCGEA